MLSDEWLTAGILQTHPMIKFNKMVGIKLVQTRTSFVPACWIGWLTICTSSTNKDRMFAVTQVR